MKKINLEKYFENGHLNDEAKALFSDAMLLCKEDMLPVSIRDHVESCQQCKKEIIALFEIMKKDSIIQNIENHPFLDNSTSNETKAFKTRNLLKIAAGLLLFAGLGSLYYVFINYENSTTNNHITHNSDSINNNVVKNQIVKNGNSDSIASLINDTSKDSSKHQNELAMSMEESALFESLIASHYRSNDIDVSFPPLNHQFNIRQVIEFKINGDISEAIDLILYNNKGGKIIEKTNISNNRLAINNKLSPGLYYWKLLKGGDLIQVGKFFVK